MTVLFALSAAPKASELAALHALAFGSEAWSPEQLQGSLALASTQGWEARREDQLVGFLLLQRSADEAEILTLAIHPAQRRQGIARGLLTAAFNAAPSTRFFLEVAADNNAAIALYESCGFTPNGRRPRYYHRPDATIDALTYCFTTKA
jgi:ribosomal-protein-alanine N-acetyltransferase